MSDGDDDDLRSVCVLLLACARTVGVGVGAVLRLAIVRAPGHLELEYDHELEERGGTTGGPMRCPRTAGETLNFGMGLRLRASAETERETERGRQAVAYEHCRDIDTDSL